MSVKHMCDLCGAAIDEGVPHVEVVLDAYVFPAINMSEKTRHRDYCGTCALSDQAGRDLVRCYVNAVHKGGL